MRISYKKYSALSLTELLIVLVIIAILFAAAAPIVTKRRVVESYQNESVWNFLPNDSDKNAYFDPGVSSWSSSSIIGIEPNNLGNHKGKLVINSSNIDDIPQYHMQFRYGDGIGINAASLVIYNNNLLLGSDNSNLPYSNNTIAGVGAFSSNSALSSNNIVIGSNAMSNVKLSNNTDDNSIIAIGSHSGENLGYLAEDYSPALKDIFVGSYSGYSMYMPDENVAIGYNAMGGLDTKGNKNVFIGANVGSGFNGDNASYNTIVGSTFVGSDTSKYNTIIGYNTYKFGDKNISNLTAIGYGACDSIKSNYPGENICIGYNSAYRDNKTTPVSFDDNGEHIFIGGTPLGSRAYGGRAVFEVHRMPDASGDYTVDTTNVILNSNLVVRGNFYPGNGSNFYKIRLGAYNYNNSQLKSYFQCKNDTFWQDIYMKNDVYHASVCNKFVDAPSYPSLNMFGSDPSDMINEYPSFLSSSDIRLKTDVKQNNDGLENILKIQPYNYTFKNRPDIPEVGVIAQDLQKIFPNSVITDKKGFLKIKIDEMFYSFINAIKALDKKLALIEYKIKTITEDILTINSNQKDLKKEIAHVESRLKKIERKAGGRK